MRFAGTIWPKKVNIMDWWETKSIVCIYAGRAHSHTRGRYANDRTDGRGAHCVTKYAKIFVHRPFITYYAFWYLHKLLSYLMAYYMMVGFHTCHEVMQLDAWMFTGYYFFFLFISLRPVLVIRYALNVRRRGYRQTPTRFNAVRQTSTMLPKIFMVAMDLINR